MDKLKALNLFIAVVDTGSFAGAAKRHNTDPSTVSKAMQRLEQDLQVQLLLRSTRRLSLTNAGEAYVMTARSLLEELHQCEDNLKSDNQTPRGRLKLNLPVSYGRLYITPLLAEFNQQYPEIELDVSYNDAYVDMIEHGIDLSVRSGTLSDSGLVAQQISPMDFLICAAPDYIQAYDQSFQEDKLDDHSWIRFRFRQSGRVMPVFFGELDEEPRLYNPSMDYVVDDGEVLAELCAQGLGLTQIPFFIARKWLDSGEIAPVYPCFTDQRMGVYLIYPKRDYLPQRTRCFIDFIKQKTLDRNETAMSTWARSVAIAGMRPQA